MTIGHADSTAVIKSEPAKLDPAQLERIKMSPVPLESERRAMFTGAAIGKLAALPPASDLDAGEPTLPALGLLPADVERIKDLARHVRTAREDFAHAEAALAKATRIASGLPFLRADAGRIAAAAFGANGHGIELAADITSKITIATNAESALPTLQRGRDVAWTAVGDARGALHREATAAIRSALRRAAERYSVLCLEVTRAVAAMDAALHALPQRLQTDLAAEWDVAFAPGLCLPSANPFGAHDRNATDLGYKTVLLRLDHPRLATHATAAKGYLGQQLAEAVGPSGIPATALLG